MTLLNAIRHAPVRRWGIVAVLLGLLILVMVTWRPSADEVATANTSNLPQPVLDSLSRKAVWCYADYQDRMGRNNALGFYPTVPLDEALAAPGAQRWMAKESVKQSVRCYTSWEAAFHRQGGWFPIRHSNTMEQVRDWLPGNANEADYEIALLYGVFRDQWQEIRDPAFSPSIRPHRWVLTEDVNNTLTTQ